MYLLLQMNGIVNGDSSSLALQGLTVQGSNSHDKPAESPNERLPRGKVCLVLAVVLSPIIHTSSFNERGLVTSVCP